MDTKTMFKAVMNVLVAEQLRQTGKLSISSVADAAARARRCFDVDMPGRFGLTDNEAALATQEVAAQYSLFVRI